MPDYIRVTRNEQNEFLVTISVEGYRFNAVIDTGMTSPDCLIGVGLSEENYRVVRPHLRVMRRIEMQGVGNYSPIRVRGGVGTVRIEGLEDSEVETYIAEVGDNLLGVCYFQRLPGYEIIWDLEAGQMRIAKKSG